MWISSDKEILSLSRSLFLSRSVFQWSDASNDVHLWLLDKWR